MRPIELHFGIVFTINRLVYDESGDYYGGDFEEVGEGLGYLERLSQDQVNQLGGVYTATHLLIVRPETDILEGDRIDTISSKFKVKGVKILNYGTNVNHTEIHLEEVVDEGVDEDESI